jgi:hypothetical protein
MGMSHPGASLYHWNFAAKIVINREIRIRSRVYEAVDFFVAALRVDFIGLGNSRR